MAGIMFNTWMLVFVVSLSAYCSSEHGDPDCVIPINRLPTDTFQPLYLQKDGENYVYVKPIMKDGELVISAKIGEEIYISCSISDQDPTIMTLCNTTQHNTSAFDLNKFLTTICDEPQQIFEERVENQKCVRNGYHAAIGDYYMFVPVIEVCEHSDIRILYVSYELDGTLFGPNQPDSNERIIPQYSQQNEENIEKTLNIIFGNEKADEIRRTMSKLMRIPLPSVNDFIFQGQKRIAENIEHLSWSSFRNWLRVESYIRKVAFETKRTLKIYAGLLDFYDAKDIVFLGPQSNKDGKTYKIPKFVWKMIVDSKEKKCIVFILHNLPVPMLEQQRSETPKKNCKNLGWLDTDTTHDYLHGFVECFTRQEIIDLNFFNSQSGNSFPVEDCSQGALEGLEKTHSEENLE